MIAIVISLAAITLLVVEMSRPPTGGPARAVTVIIRSLPFLLVSALSLWAAGRAPKGRKPFQADLSLSAGDLAMSVTKVPHLRSIAILFLVAAVAVGTRRLLLAFGLTMLVGVGWELAETTVVGHNARLADLAPNLVAGLAALVTMLAVRWLVTSLARTRRAAPSADVLEERAG